MSVHVLLLLYITITTADNRIVNLSLIEVYIAGLSGRFKN